MSRFPDYYQPPCERPAGCGVVLLRLVVLGFAAWGVWTIWRWF